MSTTSSSTLSVAPRFYIKWLFFAFIIGLFLGVGVCFYLHRGADKRAAIKVEAVSDNNQSLNEGLEEDYESQKSQIVLALLDLGFEEEGIEKIFAGNADDSLLSEIKKRFTFIKKVPIQVEQVDCGEKGIPAEKIKLYNEAVKSLE